MSAPTFDRMHRDGGVRQSSRGRRAGGPQRGNQDETPLAAQFLALQNSAGNAAVSRLLAGRASAPTAVAAPEGDEEEF